MYGSAHESRLLLSRRSEPTPQRAWVLHFQGHAVAPGEDPLLAFFPLLLPLFLPGLPALDQFGIPAYPWFFFSFWTRKNALVHREEARSQAHLPAPALY